MGGNALKNTITVRKDRENYLFIAGFVLGALSRIFPNRNKNYILAYSTKETFGDCDILLESDNLPANWIDLVKEEFKPNEMVKNGNVLSFDCHQMQIDIITVPAKEFDFAHTYFAFNDLGNLMGRIAHKAGFKYGHDGFWRKIRDENNDHVLEEIQISLDPKEVFTFLGYNYQDFLQGFETLEDIFKFAASSPFFHRDIFQLDNRNHVSRTRDAKRPTYMAFLKWIEDKPELDKFVWSAYTGDKTSPEREAERSKWLINAFDTFPGFEGKVARTVAKHKTANEVKKKFNGEIVGKIVTYKGKDLGEFIKFCRDGHPLGEGLPEDSSLTFDQRILILSEDDIESYIMEMAYRFKGAKE